MRRLPVYIVVDSSESTIGEANEAINLGLSKMIASLRRNPYALETAHISVISFDATARVLEPLTDILEFKTPSIEIRPGTALGGAIDLLIDRIKKEVVQTTRDEKGDFKPLVFFLTDGAPTDEWRRPLARFKAMRPKPANVYAIGCGDDVDYSVLSQLADQTFKMSDVSEEELPEMFAKLFVWLSASVQSASQGLGDDLLVKDDRLPQGIERVGDDFANERFDERPSQIFLSGVCAATGQKALLRMKLDPRKGIYEGTRGYALPPHFYDDGEMRAPSVSSEELGAPPSCPHCGAGMWLHCGECETLFCVQNRNAKIHRCPSCGSQLMISTTSFRQRTSLG